MKSSSIFKNDAFIFKNVPRGSEKSTVEKSCKNQICTQVLRKICFMFVFDKHFFWTTWYIFEYKRVVFENTTLFHFCGTFIDPHLCWKSKFGSVNLLLCKLWFTILWSFIGLYGLFTQTNDFSWIIDFKITQISEKILKFENFGLWTSNLAFEKKNWPLIIFWPF